MNAGWILHVALVCCGIAYAEELVAQVQYGHSPATASARIVAQPTTQYSAQQNAQYNAQTAQYQAANQQPALPPTSASAFGQQATQYQPAAQTYQPTSSFGQQATQANQLPPARSSVFSTQPTANANNQGWTGTAQPASNVVDPRYANDPRYTASVTNDPRYGQTQQLTPQENAAAQQQYTNQLNAAAAQFNNTLRDAGQQAQQYGQQLQGQNVQTWQQTAQQLGQQAQQLGQQAQQYGQQVQPYLSSLTNNPYAYVPPPPQPEAQSNQYLAANSQTADSQLGRSVLVNSPQNTSSFGQQNTSSFGQQTTPSSFGQYNNGQSATDQLSSGNTQYANNQYGNQQPYAGGGTQLVSNQQPANNTLDNRGQLYQPATNQSAFTNNGQAGTQPNNQDPRLIQTPQTLQNSDPRYAQSQDPRTQQNNGGLTLEPPLTSTLPNNNSLTNNTNQPTNGTGGQLTSPYTNVSTPRVDGQPNTGSNFNNAGTQPLNNSSTAFNNGSKTEVPSLFNNVLPTNNSRLPNTSAFGSNQFGASPNGNTANANVASAVELPWTPLVASLLCLFASIGANFYFGWNFTEYYFRYRRLLVEGEDDDRSRVRDDDREGRRR